MPHTSLPRIGAVISLVGCLLATTPVFAQVGGRSGAVNGGIAESPSGIGAPANEPIDPAQSQNDTVGPLVTAPPAGTYGGMGSSPWAGWTCTPSGSACRPDNLGPPR